LLWRPSTRLYSTPLPPPREATSLSQTTTNLVKCIDKEIDDERTRGDKEPPVMLKDWEVSHEPGSNSFMMRREWKDEIHLIRAKMPARDPILDPEHDVRGEHFPFNLVILVRGKIVMDFLMDVIEGELIVDDLVVRQRDSEEEGPTFDSFERQLRFKGPMIDETEEVLLDNIQGWLADRNIDDQLGEFVVHYTVWTEQLEYENWLQQLKDFVS